MPLAWSSALMGNLFTWKISLSPGESDPCKITSKSIDEMAARNPGDATQQQINYQQIFQEMDRRYNQAQQSVHNLFDFAATLVDHQKELEAKNAKYKERFKQWTGDHARQSKSDVENITGTNRPSALERKYKDFCDHDRMDAVFALEKERIKGRRDEWNDNYSDQYIACIIFEESHHAAGSLKEYFLRSMGLILMSAPSIGEQYFEQENKGMHEVRFSINTSKPGSHRQSTTGQINQNSLKLIMKETTENCDVSALVQRTFISLGKNYQEKGAFQDYSKEFLGNPRLQKYVEECCKFAWKLVCHTPPYELEGNLGLQKNTLFNDASHQVCRGSTSSERSSRFIVAVIWPGLFRGSPRRVIQKTEVVLSDK